MVEIDITEIDNEDKISKNEPFSMFVYGNSGTGKTRFIGTVIEVPEMCPHLNIDMEGGTRSISSKVNKFRSVDDFFTDFGDKDFVAGKEGKIDSVRINTWKDIGNLIDFMYKDDCPYKSVSMDSITEINYLCLKDVVKTANKMPRIGDYGDASVLMRDIMREMRDLVDVGKSVIISALAHQDKDDTTGVINITPAMTGKLAREVVSFYDIVGYLIVDYKNNEVERYMALQSDGRYLAKFRTEEDDIDFEIDNVTMKQIYELANTV